MSESPRRTAREIVLKALYTRDHCPICLKDCQLFTAVRALIGHILFFEYAQVIAFLAAKGFLLDGNIE